MLFYIAILIICGFIQYILHKYMDFAGYKVNTKLSIVFSVVTGLLTTYLGYKYGKSYYFIIYATVIELLMVITVVDLTHKIIPNRLNLIMGIVGAINLIITKKFYSSIVAFFVAGVLFLALALMSNGGIGGGDIKLIAPLGLIFGILPIIYIICYSFIFGAIFGIGLIVFGKKSFLSEIALAPYISFATIMFITYFI